MSNNIDDLLDAALGVEDDKAIILTIDEPSRTIKYDGELILGVEHDHQAERLYFKAPRYVSDDIDLSTENVKIYINFENANAMLYRYECSDKELTSDGECVTFSWLLTEHATEVRGTVKFSICIENYAEEQEDTTITVNLEGYSNDAFDIPIASYTIPDNISVNNVASCSYIIERFSQLSENGPWVEYTNSYAIDNNMSIYVGQHTVGASHVSEDNPFEYTVSTNELKAMTANIKNNGSINIYTKATRHYEQGRIMTDGSSFEEGLMTKITFTAVVECVKTTQWLQNEWHTTPFEGKVLKGIEESQSTPEIIYNEESSIYLLNARIDEVENTMLSHTYGYSKSEIDTKIDKVNDGLTEANNKFEKYLPLSGGGLSGELSGTYADFNHIAISDKITLGSANINMYGNGYGLINKSIGSAIGFNDHGEPTLVNAVSDRRICIGTDALNGDYSTYEFPSEGGTVALREDLSVNNNTAEATTHENDIDLGPGVYVFYAANAHITFTLSIHPDHLYFASNDSNIMIWSALAIDNNGSWFYRLGYCPASRMLRIAYTNTIGNWSNLSNETVYYYKLPITFNVG